MDCWEIEAYSYRVPNEDIYSQVNTILKMAEKRALVAATLVTVNASDFFTQDMEDLVEVPVTATVINPTQQPTTPEHRADIDARAELDEAKREALDIDGRQTCRRSAQCYAYAQPIRRAQNDGRA
jgi:hypothetical protein